MIVTNAKHRRAFYELVAPPSPKNITFDSSAALPQLPESDAGKYMAVGCVKRYLVFRYSYYNAETDRATHERQQDEAESAAKTKGRDYTRKPFKDKGPSVGTWSYVYSEENGMNASDIRDWR
jgi:hypothetical protein